MTDQVDEGGVIPLSTEARVEITVKSTFTYAGVQHWPGVTISDGPLLFDNPDDDQTSVVEDTESLLYRVTETAHRTLNAVIARMKRDIAQRIRDDEEIRRASAQPKGE
jgi:hypothetical protein